MLCKQSSPQRERGLRRVPPIPCYLARESEFEELSPSGLYQPLSWVGLQAATIWGSGARSTLKVPGAEGAARGAEGGTGDREDEKGVQASYLPAAIKQAESGPLGGERESLPTPSSAGRRVPEWVSEGSLSTASCAPTHQSIIHLLALIGADMSLPSGPMTLFNHPNLWPHFTDEKEEA